MNPDLQQGLEKFLAWWLEERKQWVSSDELRQAFLDELGERIDQFDFDQDWEEIFSESKVNHDGWS